ncbi:MAG: TM0106 family RecB-like putative nuclease [Bdellovibrionales bacterium]|nr:TM0106 family RecB-like putative nuclease [Bdellovibrionales bacterium]
MYILDNRLIFSPSDIVKFFESEFASYMDHFEKVASKEMLQEYEVHRDPKKPLCDVIAQMGNEHEKAVISSLERQEKIIKIERSKLNKSDCIKQTISAMKSGVDKIYQAAVQTDTMFGYADLLEKKQGQSRLGDYCYIPCDIKVASHPTSSAIVQLCCYCDILEEIQGTLPETIKIITKDKRIHAFKTRQFFYFYQFLKKNFMDYHSSFSPENMPIPNKHQDHKDWTVFAKKRLHKLDDISLVAGIRQTHCENLKRKNINTMDEFSKCNEERIKGMPGSTFRTLKNQASLQVSSREKNKPVFKVLSHTGERLGLEILPAPNEADVFFDMEGYPFLAEEGLEYLYGNVVNEEPKYVRFWAENKDKEVSAFKDWIKWVYNRWKKNPQMHIYHYGHYETSTIKRLMGRYGVGELEVDNLLRNHVFVDLYKVVVQGLRIGIFSYSLKEVEKLYYEKRDTQIQSGSESAVQFFHFLNSEETLESSPFLKNIELYNKDDCFSTRDLCQLLWSLQETHSIKYISHFEESPGEQQERKGIPGECERKARQLLSIVPIEKRGLSLSKAGPGFYVPELLAYMLEFHIREDKPSWWDYFSRFDMDDEEMFEDRYTIASCRFIKNTQMKYQIKFEKEQEIGFDVEDDVLILENDNPWESYKIVELDLIKGTLCLKPLKSNNIPRADKFTLTKATNDFYKNNLFKSLLKTANDFFLNSNKFGLKKCIHDLLLRYPPDLPDHKGPLILQKKNLIEEASIHALNLNHSVLCVQGPPGSGKTYTAAHIILNLIQRGKTVGVTSNSHKAVLNVLKMIFEQNTKNIRIRCQKVYKRGDKESEKSFMEGYPVEFVESKDVSGMVNVVGGTTFFFSREDQENRYDYLFVDEASQVNLANIVASARSAKNIILLGDQNQLEQPIQGAHPGESGKSALTYYTEGQTIVPTDRGIFLPISYRMHPKVCQFISDNFYDGKLSSDTKNETQKVILSPSLNKKLPDSGVCFIPVEQLGNRNASHEEAEIISDLYKKLLEAEWIDKEGNRYPITAKDILIVAPYNLQVAYLKRAINKKDMRIASVDKFQGQEAPISILSMAASTVQDAPRGVGFLLNKHRLNVAISRAKCLSIIVGSKSLLETNMSSIQNMELMNIWCRIVKYGS